MLRSQLNDGARRAGCLTAPGVIGAAAMLYP